MSMRHLSQHWHFYQPRGNDYWAAKINEQCYRPNSENGVMDHVSFNIGPTLIEWFEQNDPGTLDRMISADHGQAIAQPYNHRILPLIRHDEDLKTQIRWGKEHFKKYFGREPRGIWLPETATDIRTSKALAEEGIEYTIGAPSQAINEDGSPVSSGCYDVDLGSGLSIAYFFFHPRSGEIAHNADTPFGDTSFLDNADVALDVLVRESEGEALILLAYDAETFGHHNKFADLWADYFPTAVEQHPETEDMITLDQYLDTYGTHGMVALVERSSWSCLCGGLKRWSGDCDCAKSREQYREELLRTLEEQEDTVHDIFYTTSRKFINDPWVARDDYIHVLMDELGFEDLIRPYLKEDVTYSTMYELKELFEAEYLTQLSFTSCGWFFPDINLQTKNNIRDAYAASQRIKSSTGHDISAPLSSIDWMLSRPD
ncbi:MAG: DUF3536 domain-containing protein [Candidatus Woesearchaeota archaeon]